MTNGASYIHNRDTMQQWRNKIVDQKGTAGRNRRANPGMAASGIQPHLAAAGLPVLISILAVTWINIFSSNHWALLLVCPLHSLTGWYCPACGTTRALLELIRGHWAAALHLNPLAVCLMPPAAGLLLWRRRPRIPHGLWWTMFVLAAAFGIMRNIPAYPFTLLSPG